MRGGLQRRLLYALSQLHERLGSLCRVVPGVAALSAIQPIGVVRRPLQPFDLNGTSSYNGLQTQLLKRYEDGLSILANYTLAKSMSNTDSGFAYQNYGSLNKFNQKSEWTVASAHQISQISLVAGWQLSGAFQYASGNALTGIH
jgi:hypothetical protein